MPHSKLTVARRLADAHYGVDPSVEAIYRLYADNASEDDPRQPIKLLEINSETLSRNFQPLFFGPDAPSGFYYPSVVIEVTPEQFMDLMRDPAQMPNGWKIGELLARPSNV